MYAPRTTITILLLLGCIGLSAIFIAQMKPYRTLIDEPLSIQWNNTISKLGIEPLYPPQEDVSVGDIFVVITNDSEKNTVEQSFLSRAVKLINVSLQAELEETYTKSYTFPETQQKPEKGGDIWKQNSSSNSIFEYFGQRKNLPIALFPGFSLATVNQGNIEVGGLGGFFNSMLGLGSLGVQTTELRIPAAETYGVGSLVANGKLFEFCHSSRTKNVCTQTGSRSQMASVVGNRIFDLIEDPNDPKKTKYRYDLAIFLVSRVYMTRSIETLVSASVALNSDISVNKQGNIADQKLLNDEKSPGNSGIDQHSLAPSSSVEYKRLNSNVISVTQTLERPVVIGFRSVKSAPLDD